MRSPDIKQWSRRKNTELFALSNHLLDIASSIYHFQIHQMRLRVEHALVITKHWASGSISKAQDEQASLVVQSLSHAIDCQINSRSEIEAIASEIKSNSDEYFKKSLDLVAELIEEGDKKFPLGTKQIADAVRAAGDARDSAYEVGQKLLNIAVQNTDQLVGKYIIEDNPK